VLLGRELEAGPTTEAQSSPSPGPLTALLERLVAAPPAELTALGPGPGDLLGRFRLEREIGRGGFGRVFCATDLELGREVALKVIRTDGRGATPPGEWMRREAEAAAHLRHRNIVTLHDAGRCEGGAYLVYELLQGESLAERLRRGPLPRAEAVRILAELAAALAHAHAAGVVHRDVKPGNLFLESDGGVKLLDLGLAQLAGAIGLDAGSPDFMAPEQGNGLVDARADVYAWGRLGGLLLDGELPPEPQPQPPSRTPSTLRGLAVVARAHDPALRPRDAGALVSSLRRFEQRRRRLRLASAALLGVALAVLIALPGLLRSASAPAPLLVAVADAEVSDGELAAPPLEPLVAQALSARPGLLLVDRARIAGVLRASGKAPPGRLDGAATAFAARQVGAAVVLVPSWRREGDGAELLLEARDPATGALLARGEEQVPSTAEAELAPALARLVGRLAESLAAHQHEPHAAEVALDRAVTANLEAHRRYTAGLRCEEAPSHGESWGRPDCTELYQQALAFDPDFPLAHFALARAAVLAGRSTEEIQAVLRPALTRLERVPPRERAQLLAWQADLDGKPAEAVSLLRRAREEFGDDARLAHALGELLESQGRLAEAVAPLERAIALDPGLEAAAGRLIWILGRLDRVETLTRLADRLAAQPPYPGTLHAEIQARGWAGDLEGALRVARKAGGGGAAREDLLEALVANSRLEEAEALLGQSARQQGSRDERRLAALRLLGGRQREALTVLDRPLPADSDPQERFIAGARRATRLAATRDGAAIAAIAEEIRPHSLELAASLAPVMAYAGAVDPALALGPYLAGQPGTRRVLDALVTWRRQGAATALPELRWAAGGEGLDVAEILPPEAPAWLAAECAIEVAPDERALVDLRRFQRFYLPFGPWRAWAWPRSLLLEARLLDGLGRRAEARAALSRLEALWSRADPGQPLLSEVKALRRRLGPDGSPATPVASRRPELEGGSR
jgi:serine/threonine protein kinase